MHPKTVLACLFSAGVLVAAANDDTTKVTFHRDVLPVLQQNCQKCHRPNEAAPMSLLTYNETRPWAQAIKEAVLLKRMPPWFADPKYGKFTNEHRLTDDEGEEVGQLDGRRELKPFSQRDRVSGASFSTPDGQVEVLRRPCHVKSHLEGIAALENPTITYRLGRIEHACKEPIERHLPPQTMQINSVTTRPFVEPRLECGSKRAGGRVLALSCHQVPASEFCRFVLVPEC